MSWVSIGAVWGFFGVALGAFGAHALRRVATPEQLSWWTTATQYLLIHALALVVVGLVQQGHAGGFHIFVPGLKFRLAVDDEAEMVKRSGRCVRPAPAGPAK